jgi:hypothetical protein
MRTFTCNNCGAQNLKCVHQITTTTSDIGVYGSSSNVHFFTCDDCFKTIKDELSQVVKNTNGL